MLRIEEVTTLDAFAELGRWWNDALAGSALPSLYLTHEWLSAWLHAHKGGNAALRVLVARDESGIAGVAPLVRMTRRYIGVPMRMIEFISMARYADHPAAVTGELDWIICRNERAVLGCFIEHLLRDRSSWDALRLHPIPIRSPLLEPLREEAITRECDVYVTSASGDAVITLPGQWETYVRSLTPKFRKTLRSGAHSLQALGTLKFERLSPASEPGFFERLLDVERRSWKWTKGVSVNSAAYGSFYRDLAVLVDQRGWLRLWMLSLAGKDIAFDLSVRFAHGLHCLKVGYDQTYWKSFPGGLLKERLLKESFDEGIREVHMLWGEMGYKQRWGAVLEPQAEVLAFHRGANSRIARNLLLHGHIAGVHRRASDYAKRIMRKVGLRPAYSELTRADQI
ncbi:MAG TPA: GNAT family N-acetyltransferase [Bacteroidota bacterium]|nr:GNAT family N-acetyltransferase [Bacteroidota bacterium]